MYLKLDTTIPENTLEILDEKFQVLRKSEKIMAKNQSEVMLSWIDEVVSEDLSNLRGIIVCVGPGSYTGVRVGVTVVNSMALSLNIPIVGFIKEKDFSPAGLASSTFVTPVMPYYEREPLITKPKARL